MIEQLLKNIEEASKAHAATARAYRAAKLRSEHAQGEVHAAQQANSLAYGAVNDAVAAVQNFHHGAAK